MDESDQPQSVVRRRLSPLQIRVSGLAVVIVCCAVVLWSYRKVREQGNPSIEQARLLRSGDRGEREAAARFFRAPDPADSTIAAAALIDALKDEDVQVRCEAVRALGVVAKQLVGPRESPARATPAMEALVNVMLDRRGETRAPHSSNLARAVIPSPGATVFNVGRASVGMPSSWADESEIVDMARILNDPPWMAARALGEVAPNTGYAETAVAALTQALRTDGNERRLRVVVRSLGKFGPAAGTVVPDLTLALQKAVEARGGQDLWLCTVAETLVRIAPGTTEADQAIDALVDCVRTRERDEQKAMALKALVRMGSTAQRAVPPLIAIMKESQMKPKAVVGRRWVPAALVKIARGTPAAAEAVRALGEQLEVDENDLRFDALEALKLFGPAAASEIPRIEALKDAQGLGPMATGVLRQIAPGR